MDANIKGFPKDGFNALGIYDLRLNEITLAVLARLGLQEGDRLMVQRKDGKVEPVTIEVEP